MRPQTIIAGLALCVTLASVPARALAQGYEPRLTVAFGVGPVRPLVMGAGFVARTWAIEGQARVSKHLLVGAVFSSWDISLTPTGIVLDPPQVLPDTRFSTRSFGVSALATVPVGRLRLSSGAVIGHTGISARTIFLADTLYVGGFSVEGLLGVDVRLSRRLEAFAMYSLTLPATPGFATVSLVGGLRVSVR